MRTSRYFRAASLYGLAVLVTQAHAGDGLSSFVSRPDIHAPKWNIDVYDEAALAPGYWFLAPYKDFAKGGVEDVFTAMDMRGEAVFMDNTYQLREYKKGAATYGGFNSHELNIVNDGTRALVVYNQYHHQPSQEELRRAGVQEECEITCNGIEEYDVKSWERTWQWSSCEGEAGAGHIALAESTLWRADGPASNNCSHGYVHANSVDKTPQGDYLFSTRHTDTLYKISGIDGRIIWRLGGKNSDFEMVGDFKFSRQHHVRYRGGNATHTILSILDNAKANVGDQPPTYAHSRGLIIAVNEASRPMKARIVAQYDHPDGEGNYAFRRGNCQLLPNGNVFMGWSERGLQSEHSANGTLLMQAHFQSKWLGTYRAFKFDGFIGMPTSLPDVVAQVIVSHDPKVGNRTEAFVSWNGATEVVKWRLLEASKSGMPGKHLSSAAKTGFESRIDYVGTSPEYIVVEALARNGSVLATSRVAKTVPVEYSSLFHNPLFIAAFAITVAGVLVFAAVWGLTPRLWRKGSPVSRSSNLLRISGGYRALPSKQPDVRKGSEESLAEDDERWNEVVDFDEK